MPHTLYEEFRDEAVRPSPASAPCTGANISLQPKFDTKYHFYHMWNKVCLHWKIFSRGQA